MRHGGLIVILATGCLAAGAVQADPVRETSFVEATGQRVLQHSLVMAATPTCPWKVLTDEAVMRRSGLPLAHVDLRNGGVIEVGFTASAKLGGIDTIRHEIVTYLPERLLVLRNQATPGAAPAGPYTKIVQVIALEPVDTGHTRITISHTGYGEGAAFDGLYAFFRQDNADYLKRMRASCETKPAAPAGP